jgi:hypothetical protein
MSFQISIVVTVVWAFEKVCHPAKSKKRNIVVSLLQFLKLK